MTPFDLSVQAGEVAGNATVTMDSGGELQLTASHMTTTTKGDEL